MPPEKTSTIAKALTVLEEVVRHQRKGLRFSQIVAHTNIPKTSAHRILKELIKAGYLTHNSETERYRADLKVVSLGAEVLSQFSLRQHMRPHLSELNRTTGYATNLAIRQGQLGVYIDRIESRDRGLKLFSEVGQSFPLHSTGLGKALLAYADKETMSRILSEPLRKFTDTTITDPIRLQEELALTRERGYAIEQEETFRGIMCFGAAILGPGAICLGSVSTAIPIFANGEQDLSHVIAAVKKCGQAGSATMGQMAGTTDGTDDF